MLVLVLVLAQGSNFFLEREPLFAAHTNRSVRAALRNSFFWCNIFLSTAFVDASECVCSSKGFFFLSAHFVLSLIDTRRLTARVDPTRVVTQFMLRKHSLNTNWVFKLSFIKFIRAFFY